MEDFSLDEVCVDDDKAEALLGGQLLVSGTPHAHAEWGQKTTQRR